ncbi:MAG: hypothetical protein E7353_01820 [Clostridiales bacterium]|nr:hypothetical protein [Clostridiales bacterium]
MKKIFAVLLVLMLLVCGCSTSENNKSEYDDIVNPAVEAIKEKWEDHYLNEYHGDTTPSNKLIIKNTRIVKIKEDLDDNQTLKELFENVKYVVEFVIYSDYYGTDSKYLTYESKYCSVVIYNDNTTVVEIRNPIESYCIRVYDFSFPMVDEVIDLNSDYNQTITLDLTTQ